MIRTLHLTNAWHATSGGIATFYRSLLASANAHRRCMSLIVPSESSRVEECGEYGRIYHVAAPAAPFNPAYRVLLPHLYLLPNGPIRRILRAERPDLVEVCDKYTLNYLGGLLRLTRLSGLDYRPAVVGLSCERMDENVAAYLGDGKFARQMSAAYMKWLYFPLFDHHITVSHHTADELETASRGHMVPRGVWIRPMGVDLETFSPRRRCAAMRERLAGSVGANGSSALLVYAGRLAPEKNVGLLATVMARLAGDGGRDYRLVIAGSGTSQPELQRACAEVAPGRVAFIGHVAGRQELADLYANCDAFIHPNPSEPFGIAPLEAMASGLALVAPASGGVLSYANASNAWLVEPEPDAFAGAVKSLFSDEAERSRRTAAALETAKRFSWPNVTAGFLRLYEQLHALPVARDAAPESAPSFVSTAGNRFGFEVGSRRRAQ